MNIYIRILVHFSLSYIYALSMLSIQVYITYIIHDLSILKMKSKFVSIYIYYDSSSLFAILHLGIIFVEHLSLHHLHYR